MIHAILLLLGLAAPQSPSAQNQPCVWPRLCSQETVAQVTTCVWPNTCSAETAS